MKIKTRYTWHSAWKIKTATPQKYFLPESIDDLVSIIQEAEQKGLRVRAVGSGHSFSDVALTPDYMVDPCKLKKVDYADKGQLNERYKNNDTLVDVEGGIVIKDLYKELEEKNLAMLNMGGCAAQKLAGAVSTGTHGSGKELEAITGMVRSILLVTSGGRKLRIEPADNPITDPAKHNEANTELVQDDDTFYSVLVCFGSMGIIHSMILELRKEYWIEETRTVEKWSDVKELLRNDDLFAPDSFTYTKKQQKRLGEERPPGDLRAIFVRCNPYEVKGEHTCLVIRHWEMDKDPGRRTPNEATRNVGSWIGGKLFGPRITKAFFAIRAKAIPGMINGSIKSAKDTSYINNSWRVLKFGQGSFKKHGVTSEWAIEEGGKKYIDLVEDIMSKAAELKENNLYQTGQIGLRFVKGGKAYMNPTYQKTVCYIDTSFLQKTKGYVEILEAYQKDVFLTYKDAIPHWGKVNDQVVWTNERLRRWYPKLDEWTAKFKEFNPNGTFSNKFTDRLELD